MSRPSPFLLSKALCAGPVCVLASLFVVGGYPSCTFAQEETVSDKPTELPPVTVVVSGNPRNQSLLEYGKPVSVMEEDEVERRAASTLGETVRLEPGVRSSFFGQGASRPIIRGFGGERVRVLKNGVTTGDISDISEDHVVVADPMQAKKIEILRGPETLLYGSGAIGGAVNVIDDSIPEESLGKPFQGGILSQFGDSADNEKTVGLKLRGENGKVNWYFSGFGRETDDFEIPGYPESSRLAEQEAQETGEPIERESRGRVPSTDTETWGATVGSSYVFDDGFVGVSVGGFKTDYGVPGHSHAHEGDEHDHERVFKDDDHYVHDEHDLHNEHDEHDDHDEHEEEHDHDHEHTESEEVRIDAEQLRLDVRGRIDRVSDSVEAVKFRMGLTDYEHDEIEDGRAVTGYKREVFDSRVDVLHTEAFGFRGAGGFALLYDDFSALGEEAFLTPTTTLAPAVFLFEETELSSDVDFNFSGRVEYSRLDPEGLNTQNFVPFSVSAGPRWDLSGDNRYTLAATVAYTERAPNAVELFADGQHLARQIFEEGNSNLDKESSWGVDVVFRKNTGMLTASFTPFYQDFSNYINLAGTGEERQELPFYVYEETEAYFWGFEFESALRISDLFPSTSHDVRLEYQADYVRARETGESRSLPRIPPLRNIARLRYNYQEVFETMVEGVFVESQDQVAEFELPTSGYSLLNAEVSYRIATDAAKALRLFVRGTNLTDEEARIHTSFLKDLAPLRGRALLFGVRGSFN